MNKSIKIKYITFYIMSIYKNYFENYLKSYLANEEGDFYTFITRLNKINDEVCIDIIQHSYKYRYLLVRFRNKRTKKVKLYCYTYYGNKIRVKRRI